MGALAVWTGPVTASPAQLGQWGPLVDLGLPAAHQVLLHDGRVLYWYEGQKAQIWNPVSGERSQVGTTFSDGNIFCGAQVILPDGRVFAVGGGGRLEPDAITTAAIFDPAKNTWFKAPDMRYKRWYPTATVLPDGRVLVTGGIDVDGKDVAAAEVYDPANNSWTLLQGAEGRQSLYPLNSLLPNGKLYSSGPGRETWVLDLQARRWSRGPETGWYTESGLMYRPGKFLRSGGIDSQGSATGTATRRTQVVDMTGSSPSWRDAGPMAVARRRHNLLVLADGNVMVVGGATQGDDPYTASLPSEIWNPDTQQWTTVAPIEVPRMYHSTAILLPDGRVVSAGGEPRDAGPETPRTAQVYSPPYLFKGPRPTILGAPARIGYNSSFDVRTPDAADIRSVALIRPSAVTHANNMGQLYVPLSFATRTDGLDVTGPADAALAPPGYYMLVIKNASGVPSFASWIQVLPGAQSDFPPAPPSPTPSPSPSTPSPLPLPGSSPSPPPPAAPATLAFGAVADAYVRSTNPSGRYGRTRSLRVARGTRKKATERTYLKFVISGLTRPVKRAVLRLAVTDPSSAAGQVFAVGNVWSERSIAWRTAPPLGTRVAALRSVRTGTVEIDLGAAIPGNGRYAFALAGAGNSLVARSREAGVAPKLVLTTE